MEGAHGVFGVTNFWEHFSPEKELAQATILAEGAGRARVAHVIWSTLEDTREIVPPDGTRMPVLQGRYNVPHFDAKGEANRQFTDRGLPVTLLHTSPRSIAASAFRARTTLATCSSSSATSKPGSVRCATWRLRDACIRSCRRSSSGSEAIAMRCRSSLWLQRPEVWIE
jgi:hypothetical protein